MPTIVREAGFEIRINVRDEPLPAHVHVRRAGADIRVKLNETDVGPTLWDIKGRLPYPEVVRAVELVWRYQDELREAWRTYNGHL